MKALWPFILLYRIVSAVNKLELIDATHWFTFLSFYDCGQSACKLKYTIKKIYRVVGTINKEEERGTGTVPHCAVLSSFVATMGKVSRAAAGGASFRAVPQPFK